MFFFEISPESLNTLFLPALFAANIAAITLSGQFFKQVDSYSYRYLAEGVNELFGSDSSRTFDDGFDEWGEEDFVERGARMRKMFELQSIFRTIILTGVFILSELCLVVPFAVGCLFQEVPCVSFPVFAVVFLNVGFGLFVGGVIGMFILLVLKYRTMKRAEVRKISVEDLLQRNPKVFDNP